MKRLLFALAMVITITLASCGSGTDTEPVTIDSTFVISDTTCIDTLMKADVDTTFEK